MAAGTQTRTPFPLATRLPDMSEYTVAGRYQARDGWQAFEIVQEAPNEDVAVEHTYAEIGSSHGLQRTQVDIAEVEP